MRVAHSRQWKHASSGWRICAAGHRREPTRIGSTAAARLRPEPMDEDQCRRPCIRDGGAASNCGAAVSPRAVRSLRVCDSRRPRTAAGFSDARRPVGVPRRGPRDRRSGRRPDRLGLHASIASCSSPATWWMHPSAAAPRFPATPQAEAEARRMIDDAVARECAQATPAQSWVSLAGRAVATSCFTRSVPSAASRRSCFWRCRGTRSSRRPFSMPDRGGSIGSTGCASGSPRASLADAGTAGLAQGLRRLLPLAAKQSLGALQCARVERPGPDSRRTLGPG